MDLREKDEFGMEKRSADLVTYQSPGLSPEWQLGNQPVVSGDTPAVCQVNQMGSSPCPSVSMVDSFCSSLWNNPTSLQSLGFCDANVSTNASSSGSGLPRLDMGGVFLPTGNSALSPIISHLPTDPAFIERAARFSSFNGSSYSRMVNPISTPESMSPYSSASRGALGAHGSKSNDSGEPEFSGGDPEGTRNLGGADGGDSSSQGISVKKRKRIIQDMDPDQVEVGQRSSIEAEKESVDTKQKGEHNSSKVTTAKNSGKQAKDSSDSPKDDCVHVRARRGQATNSHSLAERVRREKISERMKFLQELVPGCSKVTGKAVMLDEIINYVQSLQRQVEFLSMKLAAINPRLDFNIDGLLSKDFLQSRGISSTTMGFSLDMMHPQLNLPPQSLIQAGMSGMSHPSEALRRAINTQFNMINGYKEPSLQMPGTWDDELHNVIQMNFDTNNPHLNTEELDGKARDGFSS